MAEQPLCIDISPPLTPRLPSTPFVQSAPLAFRKRLGWKQRGRDTMIARQLRDDRQIDRFFEKISGAQALRRVAVVVVGVRCEHDHRRLLMHEARRRQYLQTAVAIATESEVGDDQVDRELCKQGTLGFSERGRSNDRHVVGCKQIDERFADGNFVFDNENTFHADVQCESRADNRHFANVLSV